MTAPQQVVAYGRESQRVLCPHRDGAVPASAVAVSILDSSGTSLETGSATKGALDTTLGAAASAGARQVTVADATGATVGDPIIITDAAGRVEVHEIEGVSGTTVHLRDRLSRAYAITTTTVDSALIYYSLDASDTDTYVKDIYYQAIFTCEAWDGPRASLFRVADLATTNPIRYEDVRRWVPHASALRDGYDSSGLDEARETAWDVIRTRIEATELDPDVWRENDRIRSAGGLLAAGFLLVSHGQDAHAAQLVGDPPGHGGIFASYWQDTAQILGWFDEDQDRAVEDGERRRIASTRLGRGL